MLYFGSAAAVGGLLGVTFFFFDWTLADTASELFIHWTPLRLVCVRVRLRWEEVGLVSLLKPFQTRRPTSSLGSLSCSLRFAHKVMAGYGEQ